MHNFTKKRSGGTHFFHAGKRMDGHDGVHCQQVLRTHLQGYHVSVSSIKYTQLHLYGASKNFLSPSLIFQNEESILNSGLSLEAPRMWYKQWLQPSLEWLLVKNCWTELLSANAISTCCEGFPHSYSHYSEPVTGKKCAVSNLSHNMHHDNTTLTQITEKYYKIFRMLWPCIMWRRVSS
jgi:hypothetical protein